eukprot:scaffold535_cov65-Cylindrotheca_fusiformis.AAC.2
MPEDSLSCGGGESKSPPTFSDHTDATLEWRFVCSDISDTEIAITQNRRRIELGGWLGSRGLFQLRGRSIRLSLVAISDHGFM